MPADLTCEERLRLEQALVADLRADMNAQVEARVEVHRAQMQETIDELRGTLAWLREIIERKLEETEGRL